jgi:subtilisin family serine protease
MFKMKALNRLSVTGLVALACLSSAQAGITINRHDAGNLEALRSEALQDKSAIYIVQMRDEPVIAYKGGLAGFKATKPSSGGKLKSTDQSVQDYAAHLEAQHDRAIRSINAEKVYSYRYGFNGFAARMSADDAQRMKKRGDVINVWKDEIRQMQTNTSPKYIGVSGPGQAWARGNKGEDIIIGSIDSGIIPEHPSFADVPGTGPGNNWPWQGHLNISRSYNPLSGFVSSGCDFGNTAANPDDAPANCSDKLITARCYNSGFSSEADPDNPCGGNGSAIADFDYQSARDFDGHGSHTASTAGGNNGVVVDSETTISGIAPRARIAAYKVCWDGPDPTVNTDDGCASSDSAAAIDQAIIDGVDVINFSVGGSSTSFSGPDDIGFLFAADAGIFVATSNGNSGPAPQTTGTPAGVPWITAVGANQDSGVSYDTLLVQAPASSAGSYTAVEGNSPVSIADVGSVSANMALVSNFYACDPLAEDLSGKIALASRGGCAFTTKYNNAAAAGAWAIVVFNDGASPDRMDPFIMSAPGTTIPGVMISYMDGEMLALETNVFAVLDPDNAMSAANRVAGFSSRGPNGGAMDIIKPDISGPGVSILAAYTSDSGFAAISGTSMSSPHVAGSFALLKQANPNWSPAAARSALMTTARNGLYKTYGSEMATPFDVGAGEIVPTNALYPGLVYDTGFLDYIAFSCGNNVALVSPATCSALINAGFATDGFDLNLPSIAVSSLFGSQTVTRTVTSVGNGYKWWTANVDAPWGVDVTVTPDTIWLGRGESATYEITFTPNADAVYDWSFGSLSWEASGREPVRSPIAINTVQIAANAEVDSMADATGSGSAVVSVDLGYTGEYSATMSGLEAGLSVSDQLAGPGDFHAWCVDLPANVLTRIATFDSDTTNPGEDDLDLTVYLGNADCANITGLVALLGSSAGATSEETVDIPNGPAGSYYIFVDYYSAPADGPIDYTLWIEPVFGDAGNTTVTAPSEAVAGSSETVTVDYSGLMEGRYLGVLHHMDGEGEIASTIIAVDALDAPPPPPVEETP